MDNLIFICNKIELMCQKKGISINKMLIESGAGARTYHNMKKGQKPSYDKIMLIAEYFNVSMDYIAGRTDNPEVNR